MLVNDGVPIYANTSLENDGKNNVVKVSIRDFLALLESSSSTEPLCIYDIFCCF